MVERLFVSLIIPCIRPNTIPVLIHILKSAQSRAVFKKLVLRIPKILPAIESNIRAMSMDEEMIFLELIDIIFALMEMFPVRDDSYNDIVSEAFKTKFLSHLILTRIHLMTGKNDDAI